MQRTKKSTSHIKPGERELLRFSHPASFHLDKAALSFAKSRRATLEGRSPPAEMIHSIP